MALNPRELRSTHAGYRGGPAIQIEKNKVGTLAAQTGAPLLPRATPLAWDTAAGMWTVFTQGGSNGTDAIRGFVDDDDGVQSHGANEVQVLVALEGDLSRDAINTTAIRAVLGGSPTEANVDTALRASLLRELGFQIKDLSGVN